MAIATIMSSNESSKKMRQRGADPPGRLKQIDGKEKGPEDVSSENEPFIERRSKSRGRSVGRAASSRGLRRTTSSRSLAKSRSGRSLAASNKNDERAKSLGRNDRGRSKSRGRSKGATEEGRSKSQRRSEREERSKSRGRIEQNKVDGSIQGEHANHASETIRRGNKIASPSKSTQSLASSAADSTPRTHSNLHRRLSPSIEKLDAPLIPPIRNSHPALEQTQEMSKSTTNETENQPVRSSSGTSAIPRGIGRSVSAQVERKINTKSPRRSKSTEAINISPSRSSANTPSPLSKGGAIEMAPTNTSPRRPPNKSDMEQRVASLNEDQSHEEDLFQPGIAVQIEETNEKNALTRGESSPSDPLKPSPKTANERSALSKPDIRGATKTPVQTMVASASLFVTVLEGRALVPMQRNMFGVKKYSHPFVETFVESKLLGKTANAHRTVNPVWKSGNAFSSHYDGATAREKAARNEEIELRVYHCGKGGVAVFMGAARIPLLTRGRAEWYPVQQRSILDSSLFCPNASGELKVQVNFTAQSYPNLKPGHELPIPPNSEISLNLTWSGNSSLETSCVALDQKNGHVLWKECVYFANRINLSNSVARPEVQEQHDKKIQDSLVFDLGMVPENVAAFYVVLTMRDRFSTFIDVHSFQATIRNEVTNEGMGRLTAHFPSKDSSGILLRIARSTRGSTNGWKLATIVRGYKVFREFGSLLPQLQELSSDVLPFIGTPAERTALMRCGDSLQLSDYVPSPIPSKLVIGFFWKVKNKEPLKVATSLLDEELREVDAIHRTQPGSADQGVLYSGGNEEFEKFEILFSQISDEVHYICFVLGPYSRQKVDDIQNVACHVVNPTKGAELARCTLSKFESAPTKSVGLGCFYRAGKEWNFTILGLPSSETTFAGRLNEMRTHIFENPLEPAVALPHPRLLKSVMPSPVPLPPPRKLALSETVEMHNLHFEENVCTSTVLTARSQLHS